MKFKKEKLVIVFQQLKHLYYKKNALTDTKTGIHIQTFQEKRNKNTTVRKEEDYLLVIISMYNIKLQYLI